MKFVIRRVIASVVIVPVVAFAYVALYAYLVLAGGYATSRFADLWFTGFWLGGIVAVLFVVKPDLFWGRK